MVGGRGGDFGEFAVESLPLELHLHVLGERTVHALLADLIGAHAQYPREPHVQLGEYERVVGELGEAA